MISAVIPFYAVPELHTHVRFSLRLCLEPLLLHDQVKEVILIDDGSKIEIEIPESPKIRLYRITHHGIGYARNFGIEKATQPYILILDSDIILSKHIIDAFIDALNAGADVACEDHLEAYVNTVWSKCEELYWRYNERQQGKWWLSAGCMTTKREVFDKIKFETDALSDEDTLFSVGARKLNLKIVTLPVSPKHVFAITLKALKRKWYYGGRRVAISKTRTLKQVVKSTMYAPFFAVKLTAIYRYPPLIPFIIVRTFTFFRGFTSK